MKRALIVLACLAPYAGWWIEAMSTTRLRGEIDAHRSDEVELASALRTRERLRIQLPSASELARLRRAASEAARLHSLVAAAETAHGAPIADFPLGEWMPADQWQNRGHATPDAAIETTLWAAAGGDVATLGNLLSMDPETRAKAEAILAQLPNGARERYGTPEDLIADFTVKSIPLGSAQLVWFNQDEGDHATACLFLEGGPSTINRMIDRSPASAAGDNTAQTVAQAPTGESARPDHPPPQLPDNVASSATYLSLTRAEDGWRLIVPQSEIDQIAKELGVRLGR